MLAPCRELLEGTGFSFATDDCRIILEYHNILIPLTLQNRETGRGEHRQLFELVSSKACDGFAGSNMNWRSIRNKDARKRLRTELSRQVLLLCGVVDCTFRFVLRDKVRPS